MNLTDVETALQGRLGGAGIAGLQLLFSNIPPSPDPPVKPYGVVTITPDAVTDSTLGGVSQITRGRLRVVIVTEEGRGTVEIGRIRDQIVALFPMGLKLRPTGGIIEFTKPPQPKPGYEQNGNWRVPVEIAFLAS